MKHEITEKKKRAVNIALVEICVPRDEIERCEPEIPSMFVTPFISTAGFWTIHVNIDTGKIQGWPCDGDPIDIFTKPVDEGVYSLIDDQGATVAKIERNYVPNRLIPGKYGDYIDLKIDGFGKIKNWPSSPDVSEFFKTEEAS